MKGRHRRKLAQAQVRHGNLWNWSFDKFVRAVVDSWRRPNKVLEEIYRKARNEQQAER